MRSNVASGKMLLSDRGKRLGKFNHGVVAKTAPWGLHRHNWRFFILSEKIIRMQNHDARVLIVENCDTVAENSPFVPLSGSQCKDVMEFTSVCMQIKFVSPRAEALNEVKGRAQGLVLP